MTDTSQNPSDSILKSAQVGFRIQSANGALVLIKTIKSFVSELDGDDTVDSTSSVPLLLAGAERLPRKLTDSPYQVIISFPHVYVISNKRILVWKIVHEGFSFEPIKSENVVFLRDLGQLVQNHLNSSGIYNWSGLKMIRDQRGVRLDVSHKPGPSGGIMKKTFRVSISPETNWIAGKYKTTLDRSGIRIKDE
jgi:hypothetical protein